MVFIILFVLFSGLIALRVFEHAIGWLLVGVLALSFWYPVVLPVAVFGVALYATHREGKSVKPLFAGLALIFVAIGGAALDGLGPRRSRAGSDAELMSKDRARCLWSPACRRLPGKGAFGPAPCNMRSQETLA